MTVSELLGDPMDGLVAEIPSGLASREVSGLALDSRKVRNGDLFFALPGTKQDGARYAQEALGRGAIGVVLDRSELAPAAATLAEAVVVPHARRVLAFAAARFHRHPDRELELVGVTGTNGKTTTALLVASIAEASGEKPGFVGTLGSRIGFRVARGRLHHP